MEYGCDITQKCATPSMYSQYLKKQTKTFPSIVLKFYFSYPSTYPLNASSFPLTFMLMDTLPLTHIFVVCMVSQTVGKNIWSWEKSVLEIVHLWKCSSLWGYNDNTDDHTVHRHEGRAEQRHGVTASLIVTSWTHVLPSPVWVEDQPFAPMTNICLFFPPLLLLLFFLYCSFFF